LVQQRNRIHKLASEANYAAQMFSHVAEVRRVHVFSLWRKAMEPILQLCNPSNRAQEPVRQSLMRQTARLRSKVNDILRAGGEPDRDRLTRLVGRMDALAAREGQIARTFLGSIYRAWSTSAPKFARASMLYRKCRAAMHDCEDARDCLRESARMLERVPPLGR